MSHPTIYWWHHQWWRPVFCRADVSVPTQIVSCRKAQVCFVFLHHVRDVYWCQPFLSSCDRTTFPSYVLYLAHMSYVAVTHPRWRRVEPRTSASTLVYSVLAALRGRWPDWRTSSPTTILTLWLSFRCGWWRLPDAIKLRFAPPGFTISHIIWLIEHGGPTHGGDDIAVNDIVVCPHSQQKSAVPKTSFKRHSLNVWLDLDIIIIAKIYQRLSASKMVFIEEFSLLLTALCFQTGDCLLISGDLNLLGATLFPMK